MEPPTRNASFQTTVKCSLCAADLDLATVAEHVCPGSTHGAPMPQSFPMPPNRPHNVQPLQEPLAFRPVRPVLPKIDSSVSTRSGLHPSEAASIAHDLGLPSPMSAGGSVRSSSSRSRSRSRSRKASAPRQPSLDLPISQDCAFPPFPMKPKRSQTDRDVTAYKPRSSSRATTHSRPGDRTPIHPVPSRSFSPISGPTKRRVSNTSSSQRSRQGTIDDSVSVPSTATSSPRQSVFSMPLSREQSVEQSHSVPSLVPSQGSNLSEPASSVSTGMPSTPLWSPNPDESLPTIMGSPEPDSEKAETDYAPSEPDLAETKKTVQFKSEEDGLETFVKDLPREQLRTSVDMFDNPPREPMYKAKRPPPLSQPVRRNTDDQAGPQSARAQGGPATGGLTRTLTNLFSRKRSQSSSSRKAPLPSMDSPRMRALAPEPPMPIPEPEAGHWEDVDAVDDAASLVSSHSTENIRDPIPPRKDSLSNGEQADVASTDVQSGEIQTEDEAEQPEFEFRFNAQDQPELVESEKVPEDANADVDADSDAPPVEPHQAASLAAEPSDPDMHRASVDSASSYGSVRFSNRTASSRSSLPPADETRRRASVALDHEHSQQVSEKTSSPIKPRRHELIPESPTDPLYHHGRLSPVPETQPIKWPLAAEPESEMHPHHETSPRKVLLPPLDEAEPQDRPRDVRPSTPAAVKGRCRGCSNLILAGQKSVASADGRLTGRYHKECFVCWTCKEPFSTADFYVHNDHPYCAHHYHVINNTLCTGCGKGIEGQYLETHDVTGGTSKKFHHKCLQCATCRVQLDDDYFEFHGRVYCEKDAFRAANGPRSPYDTVPSRPSPLVREYINSGEPGLKGRFPERRITRLIMT